MPRSTSCCPSCTAACWYDDFRPVLLPQNTHTRLNRDDDRGDTLLLLLLPGFGMFAAAVVVVVVDATSCSMDIP